ncbi:MAG: hypothetical protein JO107_05720 [Hyphomicrobiales bacterium]|nr:hypothetical protein [Hyphomicrobiales bacterium]MBV8662582.1 hypothetical protein [Hyphomicrobiales bacterium]
MTKKPNRTPSAPGGETVVVDKHYLRDQANQALKLFVAPLSGVYAAAFGPIQGQASTKKAKGHT